jgi:hypothetical protein
MNPLIAFAAVTLLLSGQHPEMPAGMSHEEHLKQMQKEEALKKRGADAMGFDQDATTHHFRLSPTGGSIEVTVKDQADTATIAAVRSHLRAIASEFANGQFEKPFQTHGEIPPGVVDMQKRKHTIAYRYEGLPQGGRVLINTPDARSLDAVHAFLRYQIAEHRTDDAMELKK